MRRRNNWGGERERERESQRARELHTATYDLESSQQPILRDRAQDSVFDALQLEKGA